MNRSVVELQHFVVDFHAHGLVIEVEGNSQLDHHIAISSLLDLARSKQVMPTRSEIPFTFFSSTEMLLKWPWSTVLWHLVSSKTCWKPLTDVTSRDRRSLLSSSSFCTMSNATSSLEESGRSLSLRYCGFNRPRRFCLSSVSDGSMFRASFVCYHVRCSSLL